MGTTTRKKSANKRRRAPKADVYQQVTDRIVADLERGVRPWHRPWSVEHAAGRISRPLRHNGEPYQGINVLMLWASAEDRGFACPYWLTFRQAKALGGRVRKGETGSPVVYASTLSKRETTDTGEEVESNIPFLKSYTVFNADQIEGLPEHYSQIVEAPSEELKPIAAADRFFAATGADIRTGGTRAFYAAGPDYVRMPPIACFRDAASQAATLAHELCHWTGHPTRLDRNTGRKRWGDAGYAMEELVAELGAAFLGADLGLEPEARDDHASYVAEWLKVLDGDKQAIFSAASLASRAVGFLHDLQADAA